MLFFNSENYHKLKGDTFFPKQEFFGISNVKLPGDAARGWRCQPPFLGEDVVPLQTKNRFLLLMEVQGQKCIDSPNK